MRILALAFLLARQATPAHLQVARDLVSNLAHANLNVYGGGPRQIDWSADHPSARTVCSSFQTLLLMHTYNLSEDEIKAWFGKKNPKAQDYYDAIVAGKHFTRILKYTDLKPGDFIAIKYTDGHISKDGNEDSGHVMLVDGFHSLVPAIIFDEIKLRDGKPISCDAWDLSVIDSSSSGHGSTDTRLIGKGRFSGGVGTGLFRIFIDNSNAILGYAWSDAGRSKPYGPPDRLIAVGRLKL